MARECWKDALGSSAFRRKAVASVIVLIVVLLILERFLHWNEVRPGVALPDPVLAMFSPIDVTGLIFLLVYASVAVAIVLLARDPGLLLHAIQGYTVVLIFRITTIWLVPLEPPTAIIPLKDPFVQFFGDLTTPLNKDLFFSGHAATLFLLLLYLPAQTARRVFLPVTLTVTMLLLLQHVHYTIDVVAAFPFAYAAFRMVRHLNTLDH